MSGCRHALIAGPALLAGPLLSAATCSVRVIAVKPDGSTPNDKGGPTRVTALEVLK